MSKFNVSKYYAHHVGGRGGSVSFPLLPNFANEITQVIYDADESCLDQVKNEWNNYDVKIFPYCLSENNATTNFNINFCPFTSSLYNTNSKYSNYYEDYGENLELDYLFKYSLETKKVVKVETYSLDYLVHEKDIPAPDFLSIDTQGAELSILKGAKNLLKNNVVAIMCEINFVEIYENVPLFGELDLFLRSNNFILVSITPLEFGYKRIAKKFRGKTIPLQGEALYILDPNSLKSDSQSDLFRLEKLCFTALSFGYTEIAYEASLRATNIIKTLNTNVSTKYQNFVYKFYNEISKDSKLPKLWNETLTFEESLKRFDTTIIENKLFKYNLHKLFTSKKVIKKIINFLFRKLGNYLNLIGLDIKINHRLSSFENFLKTNGFEKACYDVHNRRLGNRN